MPETPFSERDQAMQPTQWKSWGMSGGLDLPHRIGVVQIMMPLQEFVVPTPIRLRLNEPHLNLLEQTSLDWQSDHDLIQMA